MSDRLWIGIVAAACAVTGNALTARSAEIEDLKGGFSEQQAFGLGISGDPGILTLRDTRPGTGPAPLGSAASASGGAWDSQRTRIVDFYMPVCGLRHGGRGGKRWGCGYFIAPHISDPVAAKAEMEGWMQLLRQAGMRDVQGDLEQGRYPAGMRYYFRISYNGERYLGDFCIRPGDPLFVKTSLAQTLDLVAVGLERAGMRVMLKGIQNTPYESQGVLYYVVRAASAEHAQFNVQLLRLDRKDPAPESALAKHVEAFQKVGIHVVAAAADEKAFHIMYIAAPNQVDTVRHDYETESEALEAQRGLLAAVASDNGVDFDSGVHKKTIYLGGIPITRYVVWVSYALPRGAKLIAPGAPASGDGR